MIETEFRIGEGRPRLKLKETVVDKLLSYTSIALYFWSLLITKYYVDLLPDFVHFRPDKSPEGYKITNTLYAYVFYQSIVCSLVNGLIKIPHQLHYFLDITSENAGKQYLFGRLHLKIIRVLVQIFLLKLEYSFIENSTNGPISITHLSIYIFLFSMLLNLVIYFFVSRRYP